MRSTFSILSARVCFSVAALLCCLPCAAQENYSLWPRRPAAVAEARQLLEKGETAAALKLLQTLVKEPGIVGKEVRDLIGSLRMHALLGGKDPGIKTYTVKRGDSWIRMMNRMKSTPALVMQLNGLMSIPTLKPGDKYKYRPLTFRIIINVPEKEVCLYEGDDFVKSYPIVDMKDTGRKNFETRIKAEQASVTLYSEGYPAADKSLLLAAGSFVIDMKNGALYSPGFYLSRQDCNELAMFVKAGTQVSIVREKNTPLPKAIVPGAEGESGGKGKRKSS